MLRLKEAAIEATSSGFVISDYSQPDNPLIFINKAFEDMTGYDRSEAIGYNCRFLQAKAPDQPQITEIRNAIKNGTSIRVVLKNYTKSGNLFWNELIVSPVKNEFGEVTNFIGIQTDVTDKVVAEMALKEKTRELTISNQSLEQFAHAVSHDLKEPLRMIATFVDYLKEEYEDKLDDQAKQYIGFAHDGAIRMQDLIDDLLEYAKVGSAKVNFDKVCLNETLREVNQNLQLLIKEKEAIINFDNLPVIKGAKPQLLTLFMNLISNALKYTRDRSPIISIKSKEDHDFHIISVKDNGIGIDPSHRDYIFQIFNRLHSKKDFPGNGIGLAICKRIIDNHNGEIWLESELNKGTEFFIKFPR